MLKKIIVIVNIVSFILFLWGTYIHLVQMEQNACEMTYMFEVPQYKKVHVTNNKFFSNYGLYYYYEGIAKIDIKSLNGAPVLFIPGNGGSYRQVRSLASVAIRMGMQLKNKVHLDYFTIDFDDELSAFYGGYLVKQEKYLRHCIRTIAQLYGRPSSETVKMVIVGHSMGGVIAKSVLRDGGFAKHIESIIFLSTPLDRPVVDVDSIMHRFYKRSNNMLDRERTRHTITDLIVERRDSQGIEEEEAETAILQKEYISEVLLISLGGGVRDLQVPAWLTTSRHSNIHAMTSAIPNVWLSCDHLSIVWCLQLMKVINRFLFSIAIRQPDYHVIFQQDFKENFLSAHKHFIGKTLEFMPRKQIAVAVGQSGGDIWHLEENEKSHGIFKNGLQKTYNQLFPLRAHYTTENLYIEVMQFELHDWLYGCVAKETQSGGLNCTKIFSLAQHISYIPAVNSRKSYAILDLQDIKRTNADWTHILVRLTPSQRSITLHCDIYNSSERSLRWHAPSWLDNIGEPKVAVSKKGAAFMQMIIEDVNDPYSAIQLNLQKFDCSKDQTDIIIRTSTSWIEGFDEFHTLHANAQEKRIIANPPVPIAGNRTVNAIQNYIYVDIHLDPNCRLIISQQFSFKHTLRRIIQRFFTCTPAYLIAVLIAALAEQCTTKSETHNISLLKDVCIGICPFKSMIIGIVCYLLEYYLKTAAADNSKYPFYIFLMLQGTAIVLSAIIALGVGILLTSSARVLKIIMPQMNNILELSLAYVPTLLTVRLTVGVAIIAITLVTCCSVGLILTCIVYFFWLSNTYRNMLLSESNPVDVTSKVSEENLSPDGNIPTEKNRLSNKDFLLHVKLLQLLLMLVGTNVGEIIAWLIKYPTSWQALYLDPQSVSIILMLISWTFLWEMGNINDICRYSMVVPILLYGVAAACIFFSQEHLYMLNYMIASVYILLLLSGLLSKMHRRFEKASNLNNTH